MDQKASPNQKSSYWKTGMNDGVEIELKEQRLAYT